MGLGTRLAGAILIALCIGAAGVSPAIPQPIEQPNQAEREEASRQANDENSQGETIWQRTVSDPLALFTFVVAAFTIVLAVSTAGLWLLSMRTARRQLRAYIAVDSVQFPIRAGDKVRAGVRLENFGQTPASSIYTDIKMEVCQAPALVHKWFWQYGSKVLGPRGGFTILSEIEAESFDAVMSRIEEPGAETIFIHGLITYRDAFRRRRVTRFCMFMLPNGQLAMSNKGNAIT